MARYNKRPFLIGLSQVTLDALDAVRTAENHWLRKHELLSLSHLVRSAMDTYVNNPPPPVRGKEGDGRFIPRTYWVDQDILARWQENATKAKVSLREAIRGAIHAYIKRHQTANNIVAPPAPRAIPDKGRYVIQTPEGSIIRRMATRKAYTYAAKNGWLVIDTKYGPVGQPPTEEERKSWDSK